MALKDKAIAKVEAFIEDITTLQVTTLSGNLAVNVITTGAGPDTKIDFKKIMAALQGAPAGGSQIKIIASSNIDFDSDVVQYVGNNLSEGEQELVTLHNEAVKNSTEARKAAIESLVSIIKGIS